MNKVLKKLIISIEYSCLKSGEPFEIMKRILFKEYIGLFLLEV